MSQVDLLDDRDLPTISALSINDFMSTAASTQNHLQSTSTNGATRFNSLPPEVTNRIFEYVFPSDKTYQPPEGVWYRIQPDHPRLRSKGLTLLMRTNTNFTDLLVSRNYLTQAIAAWSKSAITELKIIPADWAKGCTDVLAFADRSSYKADLELLLKEARRLLTNEEYITSFNQNLEVVREICPKAQLIHVKCGKTLLWEYKYHDSEKITVFNAESHRCAPPNLATLSAADVRDLRQCDIPSDLCMLYDCLFVSRPRRAGPGLSCGTAEWPEKRELDVTLWCYAGDDVAEVKLIIDLRANRFAWSQITLRQCPEPELVRVLRI